MLNAYIWLTYTLCLMHNRRLFAKHYGIIASHHPCFYCTAFSGHNTQACSQAALTPGGRFLLCLIIWGFPLRHRLSRFHEDLNMIAMIGTNDQPCWLAEACKLLLLCLAWRREYLFVCWRYLQCAGIPVPLAAPG